MWYLGDDNPMVWINLLGLSCERIRTASNLWEQAGMPHLERQPLSRQTSSMVCVTHIPHGRALDAKGSPHSGSTADCSATKQPAWYENVFPFLITCWWSNARSWTNTCDTSHTNLWWWNPIQHSDRNMPLQQSNSVKLFQTVSNLCQHVYIIQYNIK